MFKRFYQIPIVSYFSWYIPNEHDTHWLWDLDDGDETTEIFDDDHDESIVGDDTSYDEDL